MRKIIGVIFIFFQITNSYKNIILIGMPNAGKSYIGKYLSRQLKIPCIDTDDYNKYLKMIKNNKKDWNKFRQEEYKITNYFLNQNYSKIISTGGGAIEDIRIFNRLLNRNNDEIIIHIIKNENVSESISKNLPNTFDKLWIKRGKWYFFLSDYNYWNDYQLN
jgi:shikimate kinase